MHGPDNFPTRPGPQCLKRQANILRLAALFLRTNWTEMPRGWSFKDDRRVMELAKASKTLEEIAKVMNRTPDRIRKVAMRLGVSVKSKASKK
jgi:hypothetical protein